MPQWLHLPGFVRSAAPEKGVRSGGGGGENRQTTPAATSTAPAHQRRRSTVVGVRGKRTYGGRPGQRVEEQGTWASHTQKHSKAGYGRPVDRGAWTAKTVKRPWQQPAHPQYANYWAPLMRKRHTILHSAQPQHTNYWAPGTRKRHQQDHRPTESSNPTQNAKGSTGDCPGPRKGTTTRRNVTQGGKNCQTTILATSTAPAHQRRRSTTAETTPAGAQAAVAVRTQRPGATCEGKNG